MFMKFDFDYSTDRRETDSLKWDTAMVKYPMWVADMDFQVAPSIQEVVHDRCDYNIYGYTLLPNGGCKDMALVLKRIACSM